MLSVCLLWTLSAASSPASRALASSLPRPATRHRHHSSVPVSDSIRSPHCRGLLPPPYTAPGQTRSLDASQSPVVVKISRPVTVTRHRPSLPKNAPGQTRSLDASQSPVVLPNLLLPSASSPVIVVVVVVCPVSPPLQARGPVPTIVHLLLHLLLLCLPSVFSSCGGTHQPSLCDHNPRSILPNHELDRWPPWAACPATPRTAAGRPPAVSAGWRC